MFGIKLPEIRISVPDPIQAVTQAVSSVARGVDSTVKDIGRSDIGKVVEAATAPARNTVRAVESLSRGDLEGAAGNLAHAAFASNPINMASAASSSVRDVLRNDTVNTLTLGYAKDAAEIADKGKEASYGKKIDGSDWSVMGRQTIRGALIAGAVAAAPAIGSSITGMTLGEGITAAGVVVNAAKDPGKAAAALANSYIPGSGDIVKGIIDNANASQPARGTASVSEPTPTTSAPQIIQLPGGGQINSTTLLIVGAVGILGIAAVFALKR